MRVYLPATHEVLRGWVAAGVADAGPAWAVTPALQRALPSVVDEEELEYEALQSAAEASLDLLRTVSRTGAAARVVLAADVADSGVADAPDGSDGSDDSDSPGRVSVAEPVPRDLWKAVHVDDEPAQLLVGEVLARPDDGSARDALDDRGLLWFAVQEIDDVIDR